MSFNTRFGPVHVFTSIVDLADLPLRKPEDASFTKAAQEFVVKQHRERMARQFGSNTTLDYNRWVLMNPNDPALHTNMVPGADMPQAMTETAPEPGPLELPADEQSRFPVPDFSGLLDFFTRWHERALAVRKEERLNRDITDAGWLNGLSEQRQRDFMTWNSRYGSMGIFRNADDPNPLGEQEDHAPIQYSITSSRKLVEKENILTTTCDVSFPAIGPYVPGTFEYQLFWDTVTTLSTMHSRESAENNLRGLVAHGCIPARMGAEIAKIVLSDKYPAWSGKTVTEPVAKTPKHYSLTHLVPDVTRSWLDEQVEEKSVRERERSAQRLQKLVSYCRKPSNINPATIADASELYIYRNLLDAQVADGSLTQTELEDLYTEAQGGYVRTQNALVANQAKQKLTADLGAFLDKEQVDRVLGLINFSTGKTGTEELVELVKEKSESINQVVDSDIPGGGKQIGPKETAPAFLGGLIEALRGMDFARAKPTVASFDELDPMTKGRLQQRWSLYPYSVEGVNFGKALNSLLSITPPGQKIEDAPAPEGRPAGCICGQCK